MKDWRTNDEQIVVDNLNAEIQRLKEENAHYAWRDKDKNKLVDELCDALDRSDPIQISIQEVATLIQRAREATHGT